MLVRRSAWEQVGGLDESFRFAFDLDLLLKIQPLGGFVDVGQVVSSFRWHGDSLTVGDRSTSLHESEVARRRALRPGSAAGLDVGGARAGGHAGGGQRAASQGCPAASPGSAR